MRPQWHDVPFHPPTLLTLAGAFGFLPLMAFVGSRLLGRKEESLPQAAAAPPGVVILSPDPYYDGVRPIRRPRPPHAQDPGPPPGQRPCQNLAGIKRNNC